MQRSTELVVRKSPTGKHWWVVYADLPGRPFAVRDTKWQAEAKRDDLQRIVNRMGVPA